MKGWKALFRRPKTNGGKDIARIGIGPLRMCLKKVYGCDIPHETTLIIPRVEMRTHLKTPLFSYRKEIIYNSVTIVDAPRAPLPGEPDQISPARPPMLP